MKAPLIKNVLWHFILAKKYFLHSNRPDLPAVRVVGRYVHAAVLAPGSVQPSWHLARLHLEHAERSVPPSPKGGVCRLVQARLCRSLTRRLLDCANEVDDSLAEDEDVFPAHVLCAEDVPVSVKLGVDFLYPLVIGNLNQHRLDTHLFVESTTKNILSAKRE